MINLKLVCFINYRAKTSDKEQSFVFIQLLVSKLQVMLKIYFSTVRKSVLKQIFALCHLFFHDLKPNNFAEKLDAQLSWL